MNFNEMTFDEVKEIAKQKGIKIGNIGKEKLIEKINKVLNGEVVDDSIESDVKETENGIENNKDTSVLSTIGNLIGGESEDLLEVEDKLPMNTIIPVKSMTYGTVIYKSPTNNAKFKWKDIGSVIHMSIADITEMNNHNNDFLNKPMVILLNEKAVKHFNLATVYENVAQINDLKKLFKSDERTIAATIDNALDVNMRDILISKASTMYKNGELSDIRVIRLLEKKLQYDLSEMV